ncbi:hypothetical protein LCGC14_2900770, partial [marine sediment metagenome]
MTRKDYQFIAELLTDVWFLNYTAAGSIENGEDDLYGGSYERVIDY